MQEVTIAEAAKCLGISIDTVRRRISKEELKARKVPSPHGEIYLVELPSDVVPSHEAPKEKTENTSEVEACERQYLFLRLSWKLVDGKFKNCTCYYSNRKNNYRLVKRRKRLKVLQLRFHGGAALF